MQKEISYTADLAGNLKGGRERGWVYISQLKACLDISFPEIRDWGSGNFHLDFMINNGMAFSSLAGDIQVASNIESPNMASVFELYYTHSYKNHTIQFGLIDINAHFLFTDYSLDLINSSFGIQPTLSVNIPLSIFPLTSTGLVYKNNLSDHLLIAGGIFDGVPDVYGSASYIPGFNFSRKEGLFSIVEALIKYDLGNKPVNIKLGTWMHTGKFESEAVENRQNNLGLYLIIDRMLAGNRNRGLYTWVKTGTAPFTCNTIKYFSGAGLTFQNLFRNRPEDYMSLALASAFFCNHLDQIRSDNSHETVIELTLKKHFGILYFQPDLQYIVNPSGLPLIENSLCGIFRFGILI